MAGSGSVCLKSGAGLNMCDDIEAISANCY